MDAQISALVKRLEAVTSRLETIEKQVNQGGAAPSAEGSSASVQEYEDLINQYIKPFAELSANIGGVVKQQADLVLKAVQAQREFLKIASESKKPSDEVFSQLLKPTGDLIAQIIEIKDKEIKSSNFFNHVATVAEGISCLTWVAYSPAPSSFVNDTRPAAEFYSNKILKEFRGKDENQVKWVNSFIGFLKDLQPFIKRNHTTGVTWNPKGGDAPSSAPAPAPATPSGGPAPPPPGPPPPPPVDLDVPSSGGGKPDMSAVFSALNKGEQVTKGLKKVTDDMKTKNRKDKTSVVPVIEKKKTPAKTTKPQVQKPPKFSLEGNKWIVEYQVDNRNIVISDTEPKQTVYIFKCKNSTIQIKGKVNAVTLDNCEKTALVFDNVVASFEVVNCTSVETQVVGKVPSIAIDKTSGIQLYLSKESLSTEIITSKSSEMNVLIPDGDKPDPVEIAVPEQYKTVVKDGKLVTEVVSHV